MFIKVAQNEKVSPFSLALYPKIKVISDKTGFAALKLALLPSPAAASFSGVLLLRFFHTPTSNLCNC
ncbi:hypothetical protein HanIR_Chr04g0174741 [Helianthus annuus]|nr:hypothetical protein HanIR_Chr04g0174741 [Helianthus annuus]